MDALNASGEMLSIASAKIIYGRIIHDCMDGHRTDIKDGKNSTIFIWPFVSNGSSILRVTVKTTVTMSMSSMLVFNMNVAIHTAARASYETWAMSSRLDNKGR